MDGDSTSGCSVRIQLGRIREDFNSCGRIRNEINLLFTGNTAGNCHNSGLTSNCRTGQCHCGNSIYGGCGYLPQRACRGFKAHSGSILNLCPFNINNQCPYGCLACAVRNHLAGGFYRNLSDKSLDQCDILNICRRKLTTLCRCHCNSGTVTCRHSLRRISLRCRINQSRLPVAAGGNNSFIQ